MVVEVFVLLDEVPVMQVVEQGVVVAGTADRRWGRVGLVLDNPD